MTSVMNEKEIRTILASPKGTYADETVRIAMLEASERQLEFPGRGCGTRLRLQAWFMANRPKEGMIYKEAAEHQIMWVRDNLSYLIFNSLSYFRGNPLLTEKTRKEMTSDERGKMLTVDGTHTSKSILLPVYRFDCGGVTIKIRGNFHDWCVRCYSPMVKPFPDWMHKTLGLFSDGYFEGMEHDQSATSFCVHRQEHLYLAIAYMLNEGIARE